jgi:hypothetical protein
MRAGLADRRGTSHLQPGIVGRRMVVSVTAGGLTIMRPPVSRDARLLTRREDEPVRAS